MEKNQSIKYDQVLNLIHQLSIRERKKLAIILQSEFESKSKSNKLKEILLEAPIWSDSEIDDYNFAREHINNSRIA